MLPDTYPECKKKEKTKKQTGCQGKFMYLIKNYSCKSLDLLHERKFHFFQILGCTLARKTYQ